MASNWKDSSFWDRGSIRNKAKNNAPNHVINGPEVVIMLLKKYLWRRHWMIMTHNQQYQWRILLKRYWIEVLLIRNLLFAWSWRVNRSSWKPEEKAMIWFSVRSPSTTWSKRPWWSVGLKMNSERKNLKLNFKIHSYQVTLTIPEYLEKLPPLVSLHQSPTNKFHTIPILKST